MRAVRRAKEIADFSKNLWENEIFCAKMPKRNMLVFFFFQRLVGRGGCIPTLPLPPPPFADSPRYVSAHKMKEVLNLGLLHYFSLFSTKRQQ